MNTPPTTRTLLLLGLLGALCMALGGCMSPIGGRVSTSALHGPQTLTTAFETVVFTRPDRDTVDVYLSDLSPAMLADGGLNLSTTVGTIVHVHMFLTPRAGDTPIEATACNATVRQLVLSGSSTGLYGGGGFVLPRGRANKSRFRADLLDATVRLVRADPQFADRLGPAQMAGSFTGYRDDVLAQIIERRLNAKLNAMPRTKSISVESSDP